MEARLTFAAVEIARRPTPDMPCCANRRSATSRMRSRAGCGAVRAEGLRTAVACGFRAAGLPRGLTGWTARTLDSSPALGPCKQSFDQRVNRAQTTKADMAPQQKT